MAYDFAGQWVTPEFNIYSGGDRGDFDSTPQLQNQDEVFRRLARQFGYTGPARGARAFAAGLVDAQGNPTSDMINMQGQGVPADIMRYLIETAPKTRQDSSSDEIQMGTAHSLPSDYLGWLASGLTPEQVAEWDQRTVKSNPGGISGFIGDYGVPLLMAGMGGLMMGPYSLATGGDLIGGAGGELLGGAAADALGTGSFAAADAAGLTQMGIDAGLSGSALDAFVASGGTLGSTAAGGLGGASTIADSFGLPTPDYVPPTYQPTTPNVPTTPTPDYPMPPPTDVPTNVPDIDPTLDWPTLPDGSFDWGSIFSGLNWGDILKGVVGGVGGHLGFDAMADAYRDIADQQAALAGSTMDEGRQWANRLMRRGEGNAQDILDQGGQWANRLMNRGDANAQQFLDMGQPYRNRLNASYRPGFDLMSQPGYGDAFDRIADITTRQYSTRGNPANNPGIQGGILNDVWNQSYLPALSDYRGQLGTFGNMGVGEAANLFGNSLNAGANMFGNALNSGADLFGNALGVGANVFSNSQGAANTLYGNSFNAIQNSVNPDGAANAAIGWGLNTAMGDDPFNLTVGGRRIST